MKLDVHNLFLKDAIDEILIKFDECKEIGDNVLEIIHGHKHGTRIRDYIRSDGFVSDASQNGHTIIGKNFSDDGITIFHLKPMTILLKKNQTSRTESLKNSWEHKINAIYCVKCKETMTLLKEYNWFKCPKCGKLIKR
ncbi:MAG: Smr/MutS family protein [Promethearchaeota archaeon]